MGFLLIVQFAGTSDYYIGTTRLISVAKYERRLRDRLRRGASTKELQAAFDRFGEAAMSVQQLKWVADHELDFKSEQAISKLRPALNPPSPGMVKMKCRFFDLSLPRGPYNVEKYHVGNGRQLSVKEIAAETGLSETAIHKRIRMGVRGPTLGSKSYQGKR